MMDLKGKRTAVVGLGRSGVAAARLLATKGAHVMAVDVKDRESLSEALAVLEPLKVEVLPGGHHPEVLRSTDLVVLSPGVDASLPLWEELKGSGIEVIGELELASRWVQEPIVAVTGTNGKTTTTALIGHLLRSSGKEVFVGGNIGSPLAEYVMEGKAELVVLEVSSFQLETIRSFHPGVAVLLNVSPDHLDRHGTFEGYLRAKARIFANQTSEDWAVLNLDDPQVRRLCEGGLPPRILSLSKAPLDRREGVFSVGEEAIIRLGEREERLSLRHLPLLGTHNLENVLAAVGVGILLGLDPRQVEEDLRRFKPLPHRLELVGRVAGVTFFDDSKATNPLATLRAVEALGEGIVLIAGGQNKGLDLSPLRQLAQRLKGVVAIGEAAEEVLRTFDSTVPSVRAEGMEEAVQRAFEMASAGDVVLLSPACASFDMFRDYRQRGEAFKRAVEGLRADGR